MLRIFIPDNLAEEGLAILRAASGFELDVRSGLKGDDLKSALAAADGVIVRSGTTLTIDLLQGLTKLRAVVRAGVGVDNIDVAAATRQGEYAIYALADRGDGVDISDQPQPGRPNRDAGEQIAEHAAEAGAARQRHGDGGGSQQDDESGQHAMRCCASRKRRARAE